MSAPYVYYAPQPPHHGHLGLYHAPPPPQPQPQPAAQPFPTPQSLNLTNCTFPGFATVCQICHPLREVPEDDLYPLNFRVEFAPSNSLGAGVQGAGISLGGILTRARLSSCRRHSRGTFKYFLSTIQIDGYDYRPSTPAQQLYIPGNCEHQLLTRADIAAWVAVAVAGHLGVQDVRYLRANLVQFQYVGEQLWKAVVRRTR
ncbi:hypothetical protein FB45DRAFT_870343 [Roridomyces roridus]|uniref:Uncharacterized protein n=1 Tax=Roridomyces roridus TaxID=1738132 RepID=A0AAD7FIA7_9AGAR|nr:hypothetical protein FB45DRAFT_870343 [Roridomyces roridus]